MLSSTMADYSPPSTLNSKLTVRNLSRIHQHALYTCEATNFHKMGVSTNITIELFCKYLSFYMLFFHRIAFFPIQYYLHPFISFVYSFRISNFTLCRDVFLLYNIVLQVSLWMVKESNTCFGTFFILFSFIWEIPSGQYCHSYGKFIFVCETVFVSFCFTFFFFEENKVPYHGHFSAPICLTVRQLFHQIKFFSNANEDWLSHYPGRGRN